MNAASIHHADNATRVTLIERVKNPLDDESWQDFFQTYWKLIYQLALRLGLSDSEAEEVVQLTMIAVSRNIPKFKYNPSKGSFRNWLLQQARWQIRDAQRAREREGHLVPIESREQSPHYPSDAAATATAHRVADDRAWRVPDASWSETVHSAAVAAVRAQFTVKQYQMFDLYVLRHWPAKRVTATLGVRGFLLYLWSSRVRRVYEKEIRRIAALESSCPANA
jgi:RNA polymerase sigma factor (sigma-70 family)